MPIILFGSSYWDDVLNLDAMIEHGAISVEEETLIFKTDSVDAAFYHISADLEENALNDPDEVVSAEMRGDSKYKLFRSCIRINGRFSDFTLIIFHQRLRNVSNRICIAINFANRRHFGCSSR
jgi:hypothetical protein